MGAGCLPAKVYYSAMVYSGEILGVVAYCDLCRLDGLVGDIDIYISILLYIYRYSALVVIGEVDGGEQRTYSGVLKRKIILH